MPIVMLLKIYSNAIKFRAMKRASVYFCHHKSLYLINQRSTMLGSQRFRKRYKIYHKSIQLFYVIKIIHSVIYKLDIIFSLENKQKAIAKFIYYLFLTCHNTWLVWDESRYLSINHSLFTLFTYSRQQAVSSHSIVRQG